MKVSHDCSGRTGFKIPGFANVSDCILSPKKDGVRHVKKPGCTAELVGNGTVTTRRVILMRVETEGQLYHCIKNSVTISCVREMARRNVAAHKVHPCTYASVLGSNEV